MCRPSLNGLHIGDVMALHCLGSDPGFSVLLMHILALVGLSFYNHKMELMTAPASQSWL